MGRIIVFLLVMTSCSMPTKTYRANLCAANTTEYTLSCMPAEIAIEGLSENKSIGILFDNGQAFITTIDK